MWFYGRKDEKLMSKRLTVTLQMIKVGKMEKGKVNLLESYEQLSLLEMLWSVLIFLFTKLKILKLTPQKRYNSCKYLRTEAKKQKQIKR